MNLKKLEARLNRKKRKKRISSLRANNLNTENKKYINHKDLAKAMLQDNDIYYTTLMDTIDWEEVKYDSENSDDEPVPKIAVDTSTFADKEYTNLPSKIKDDIEIYKKKLQSDPLRAIEFYSDLKNQYPNVRLIYNFLSCAYRIVENKTKTLEITLETLAKFPDYLFAKFSLGEIYIEEEKFDDLFKLFDGKLHLHYHLPKDRKGYHPTEIVGFYDIIGIYHAKKGNLRMALWCYSILREIAGEVRAVRVSSAIVEEEIKFYKNQKSD